MKFNSQIRLFLQRFGRSNVARAILFLWFTLSSYNEAWAQRIEPDTLSQIELEEVKQAISKYVRIRSISGNEKEAASFLVDYARSKGLIADFLTEGDSTSNVYISLFPIQQSKPNILLLSHIDVVQAQDSSEWAQHPFSGKITGDTVWGRGALDCKGLTLIHLQSLLQLKKQNNWAQYPLNVTVIAVAGEETGGFNGGAIVSQHFLEQLNPVVVFGEGGAGLQGIVPSKPLKKVYAISVAEKTNLWLKLELSFKTFGHGASPPRQYVNKMMLKALGKLSSNEGNIEFNRTNKRMFKHLGNLEGGFTGWVIKHMHWPVFRPVLKKYIQNEPFLGALVRNTYVLTNLYNPPGPPNQIPNRITAYLDCRLLPGTNRKKFLRQVKYGLFEPRFKITTINECPEAEESSPNNPYYKLMEKAILKLDTTAAVVPVLFPASSDNNYFRAKGLNVYGLFPFMMSDEDLVSIHGINEKITGRQIQTGVTTTSLFLKLAMEEMAAGNSRMTPTRSYFRNR